MRWRNWRHFSDGADLLWRVPKCCLPGGGAWIHSRKAFALSKESFLQLRIMGHGIRRPKPHVVEIFPRDGCTRVIADCEPCWSAMRGVQVSQRGVRPQPLCEASCPRRLRSRLATIRDLTVS